MNRQDKHIPGRIGLAGFTLAMLAAATVSPITAQDAGKLQFLESASILNNSVTNLHAVGDSLWVGPFLNLTTDGGDTWSVAETDSLRGSANRVFSIDVEGQTVVVGLGFVAGGAADGVQSAGGFLVSEDGGDSFFYRQPQLDIPGETTIQYGVSTLEALDVIVREQSPPFDIDFDPARNELWVAGWASGIRKSTDRGRTWQRVVLPPDELTEIHPDSLYDFKVEPQRGTVGSLNHMGFAVLVDETGTVWAGTPAGVNRSTDGGLAWTRFSADGNPTGLTGSWVISIEEQPFPGRNPVWMATWNAGEAGENGRFGITVTRDGGSTFEQVLIGERIYDFAFKDGIVYAAGDNGLFISEDNGQSWRVIRQFRQRVASDRVVRPDARVFSVATTRFDVWVGTSDGLLRSVDNGLTWEVFRVEVPLHPETPSESIPDSDVFAYPNPFSPRVSRFVRIRYELAQPRTVDVRIYDFGMNLVRQLVEEPQDSGIREVTWDGADDDGARLANGVYVYSVDSGSDTFWGKILLIE